MSENFSAETDSSNRLQGHCQAYEFSQDNCDVTGDSKWPESGSSDHVSHYSKTASPYSAAASTSGHVFLTVAMSFLLFVKLF
jgi:hypothetical protein